MQPASPGSVPSSWSHVCQHRVSSVLCGAGILYFMQLTCLRHTSCVCRVEIIQRLQAHIVELSTHKFASNVVEKCLEFGTRDQRRRLVSTMLGEGSGLDSAGADQLLQTMTKDQYGNYVVQKTLEVQT